MSDFQIKLKNGQIVNYSDLSKRGIQIEDVSPEYRNIFEVVQKFVNKKLNNENGSDGNNNVLSTAELSIFADTLHNKAKGHNSKNLGKREFNSLMKEFEEAGVSAKELNFDKNKFIGFIKNLFDNRHNYDPKATVVVNQNSQEGVLASLDNAARPIEVRDPETGKLKQKTILENGIKTVIKYDENEKPVSETVTNHANNSEITYKYVDGKKIPEKEVINKGTDKEEVTNYKLDDTGVTLTSTTEKKDGTKVTTRYIADENDNFNLTKPNEQIIENGDTIVKVQQSFDENGKPVITKNKSKKTGNDTERKVLEDVVTSDGRTITEYDDDGKATRKEEHKYKTLPDGSVEVEQTIVTNYDKNGNSTRVKRNAKQQVVSTENLASKSNKATDAERKRAEREAIINAKLAELGVDVENKGDDAGKSIDFKIPSTETKSPNLINGWKRKRQFNQYSQDVSSDDWKKCKTENRVEIDCSKYKNVKELAKDLFWMEGFDPDNSPAWQARIKERAAKICKDWGIKTADGKLNIGGKINGKRYLDMAENRPEIRYVQEYAPAVNGTVLGDVKGTKYQVVQGDDGQLYYIDKNTKKSVEPNKVRAKIAHAQAQSGGTQEAYIYTDSGVFGNKVKVVPTGEVDQNGNQVGVDENGHKYIIMSKSQLKASDIVDESSPYAKKVKSDKNQKVAIRLDSKKGAELYSKFVTADNIANDKTRVSSVSMMRGILSGLYKEICDAEKQIHNRDLEMRQRDGMRGAKFQYSQNLEKLVDKLTFAWNMNREEVLAKLKAEGDKLFKLTNESYNIQRNHDTQGMTPEQIKKYDESKVNEFLQEYNKVFGNFEPTELAKLYATGQNNKLMDNLNAKVDVKQLQNDVSEYIQGQESGREAIKEMPKYIAIGTVAGVAEGITGGGATPLVATMCAATLWNTAEELIKNDKEFDINEMAKKVAIDTALTYGPIKGFQALERGLGEMLVKKAIASGISREAAHALSMSEQPLTLLKGMVKSGEITDKVVSKLVTHSSAILAAETIAFDTVVGTTAEVVQTGEVTADGVIKYASISAVAQGMFLLARGAKGSPKEAPEVPKPDQGGTTVIGERPQTVLGKATGEGTHLAGGKLGETTGVGKNKQPGKMPRARKEVAEAGKERDVAVRRQTQDLPVRRQSRELEHIWDDNAGIVTIGKEHFDVYAETDLAKLKQLKKKVDNWSDTSRPIAELDSEKLLIQQKIDERIKFLEEHPEVQGVKVESETVRKINESTEHTVDRILSKDKRQVITEEEARVIDEEIANKNTPQELQNLRDRLDGRFGITDNNHVSTVDKLRKKIDAKIKKLNEQADMLKATVDEIKAAKEGKASFDGGDKVAKLLQDKVEGVKLSDAQKTQLVTELEQSGLKVKANTKKAVKEFKKAKAEKIKAETEQPKVEKQNTTQQKRTTAMDILSDFEHPITSEDVRVVSKEIDTIMENNSLTQSQKRGYLQSMYDGLETRPQSPEVLKLKNYIDEQFNKLKSTTSNPRPVEQNPVRQGRENYSAVNESNIGFGRRNPNKTRFEEIKSEFEKAPKDVDVERVGSYAKNSSSEEQINFLRKKLAELKGKEGVNNAKVDEAIGKADAQLKILQENWANARKGIRANKPATKPDIEIIGVEPPKNDGIVDLANPTQRDGFVEQMRRQQQSIDDVNNQIAIDNANYFIDEFGQINWTNEPHNDFGF